MKSGQVKAGQVRSGEIRSVQTMPGQVGSGQVRSREVSMYLIRFIKSYFSKWKIWINDRVFDDGRSPTRFSSWPSFVDHFFELSNLKIPGATLIGFVNDLALMIVADKQHQLEYVANRALKVVRDWMVGKELELGLPKTDAIILCEPRKRDSVCFNIEKVMVKPAK